MQLALISNSHPKIRLKYSYKMVMYYLPINSNVLHRNKSIQVEN